MPPVANLSVEESHPIIKGTCLDRSESYGDFVTVDIPGLDVVSDDGLVFEHFLRHEHRRKLFVRCWRNVVVRFLVSVFTLVFVA